MAGMIIALQVRYIHRMLSNVSVVMKKTAKWFSAAAINIKSYLVCQTVRGYNILENY
jgi:acetolactate synthase small subunit